MTPTLLTCPGCGTDFEKTNPTQKYCTTACQVKTNNHRNWNENKDHQNAQRNQRRAERLPIRQFQCEQCGKTVETREVRPRRFCSKKCKDDNHNATWPAANADHIRQYRAATRDHRTRSHGIWRQNNLAQQQEYARTYAQASREATPWVLLMRSAKNRAKEKGLPFDLTAEWAVARWTGKCELTGIAFILGGKWGTPRTYWPTIDKIEPARGYVQDNCRFVLWAINTFKGQDTDAVIYEVAEALLAFRK